MIINASTLSPLVNLMSPNQKGCSGSKPTCIDTITEALTQSIKMLGFDYVRFGRWVNGGQAFDDTYSSHIGNFPANWVNYYDNNQLFKYDPIVRFSISVDNKPIMNHGTWSQVIDAALKDPLGSSEKDRLRYKESVKSLFSTAKHYGVCSGVFISGDGDASRVQMSLASGNDTSFIDSLPPCIWSYISTIMQLTDILIGSAQRCRSCSSGINLSDGRTINLTKNQRVILDIFLKHRRASIEEVARVYGSSKDNINFHLKNIRDRFEQPGVSGHMLAQFAKEHKFI